MVRFLSWLESFLIFCLCDAMKYFKEKATNTNQINWSNQLWKIKHRIIGSHHIQIQNVKKGVLLWEPFWHTKMLWTVSTKPKTHFGKRSKTVAIMTYPFIISWKTSCRAIPSVESFSIIFSSSIRNNHTGCKQKNHIKVASICLLEFFRISPFLVVLNLIFERISCLC